MGPDCPVYLWDERYTSKEAAARLHSKNPDQSLYGLLDAEAACIILENFYTDNGEGAERVQVDAELEEIYTKAWQQKQRLREQGVQNLQEDRARNLRWKQEAIRRDREMEQTSSVSPSRKKKKKKKKKN